MADQSIATPDENAGLEHSQGGATTRQDGTDAGVPMLQGDPAERQGPEDALGPEPKRGDYSTRLGNQYNPHIAVKGADGLTRLVAQTPNAGERGEQARIKGGVDVPASNPVERSMASAARGPVLPTAAANGGYDPASLPALPWAENAPPSVRNAPAVAVERAPQASTAGSSAEPMPRHSEAPAPVEQPRGGGVDVHTENADPGSKRK
jgi:hypothetical protein